VRLIAFGALEHVRQYDGVERDALQLVDGDRERANDWEELERTRSRAVAGTRRHEWHGVASSAKAIGQVRHEDRRWIAQRDVDYLGQSGWNVDSCAIGIVALLGGCELGGHGELNVLDCGECAIRDTESDAIVLREIMTGMPTAKCSSG
jgi:hypothetical protein